MKNIVVLGGTGFVGRAVCERLAQRSSSGRILVPTRRLPRANGVRSLPTVEVVEADVHDDAQLARLLAGNDAVINLVAILHGDEAAFRRVHVDLPRRLIKACQATGVRRVLHISALGVSTEAPSLYLRSKAGGEGLLQGSGLDLTLLRPSVIFGAHDRFTNLFAQLQSIAPLMPLAGGSAQLQPVWVEDVAAAVLGSLDRADTIGKTYECAGPAVYALSELVRLAGHWSGHARPQLPLPQWAGWLQAAAMELLPGEPLLSRDNLRSLTVPNIATGSLPGLTALGITPTALEAVAPGYLGDLFQRQALDRYRAGVGRR
jgi:NADH dehydrogenase